MTPMLNVKTDWLVAPTTVDRLGLVVTTVATLHSVTTLKVQPGIVVVLMPNVERDLEIAILMKNVKMDWSAKLMVVDLIGLKVMTVVSYPDYLTRIQTIKLATIYFSFAFQNSIKFTLSM